MQIEDTTIPGVKVLTPRRFDDSRGFFSETWSARTLSDAGIDIVFVQDNLSVSETAGTVRGLHYQSPPHAQAKLVRCARGAIFDVAVDVRRCAPTYGQWVGVDLSFENGRQLLVPEGCLHGFATRLPGTEVVYKCSDFYAPDCDGAVAWNDPDLGIDWGLASGDAILSEKDRTAPAFAAFDSPFVWEGAV
ncbi:dTDP-4-dehydrorhamnose 3,5-epimerase [Palleronia abyssalis]|uniref:dTDP-4-dehydrorhamnose 3,5-epimerase n=1 Tax=Palleronia abyssalis TaxID=1501240 RepID=A0A2R8BUQ8_9RHOB|nr:dTDP-4-dehydrorhamnose 3,5-epimerase [Palleronia abyssalis]SPJ23907.1 dTDP-4-dehydrorhamnose 3,5-epimerase [Palleronia abyssalis]